MHSAFIDTTRLAVTDRDQPGRPEDAPINTIYIRRKMDYGTKMAMLDELGALQANRSAGSYSLFLAYYNILAWDGPIFGDRPCTRESIAALDPDLWLLQAALNMIAEHNPVLRSPKKNRAGSNGLQNAGAKESPATAES